MKTTRELFEELVLNPILSNRPKSIPQADFLEDIFCLNTRPIGRYHCFADVEIKGNLVEGRKVFQETTYKLKRQDHIIARMDDTQPTIMEIESERNGVIRIDVDQWDRVQTKMWRGKDQDEV